MIRKIDSDAVRRELRAQGMTVREEEILVEVYLEVLKEELANGDKVPTLAEKTGT